MLDTDIIKVNNIKLLIPYSLKNMQEDVEHGYKSI